MDSNTNHLSLKTQLESMLRASGPLAGLPIVAVTGHTENAIRCDNNEWSFEEFVKASIGVDNCGKPALRVKFIDSCDVKVDCANHDDANPLRDMFAYDSTTDTYALVLNQSS